MSDSANSHEMVVNGEKIPTEIREIDISKLVYWKENPRVNAIIKQKYKDSDISDQEIEKELWEKDSVKELYKDIERHGGLIDEILIKGNVVLEGNSRLCAYRHLYSKAVERSDQNEIKKWSTIRSRVLPVDTSEKAVFSILGTWHIKGKTQWDTYEKAAYLKRMKEEFHVPIKDIAISISLTEKFVKDNIEAHDLMVANNVYTLEKFSYFFELVKEKNKANSAEKFVKEPIMLKQVIETIKSDSLKRAEDIRDLPKIINDPKAKKLFTDGKADFYEAVEISKKRHPEEADTFFGQIKRTTKLIQGCSVEKIDEIKKDAQKKYIFKCLFKEVKGLAKKLQ